MADSKIIASGKNVSIRECQNSDINEYAEWLKDSELASYAFGITTTKENLKKITDAFIIELSLTLRRTLSIIDKEGNLLGFVRTTDVFFPVPHTTIGITLGKFENCGHSFGYEALMLSINYLFQTKKIFYIELDTAVFNERAMRCFLKCGVKIVKNFTEVEYITKVKMYKTLFRLHRNDFLEKYQEYIKSQDKL